MSKCMSVAIRGNAEVLPSNLSVSGVDGQYPVARPARKTASNLDSSMWSVITKPTHLISSAMKSVAASSALETLNACGEGRLQITAVISALRGIRNPASIVLATVV